MYFHFKFYVNWTTNKSFKCFTKIIKLENCEKCNILTNLFWDFQQPVGIFHTTFKLPDTKGIISFGNLKFNMFN